MSGGKAIDRQTALPSYCYHQSNTAALKSCMCGEVSLSVCQFACPVVAGVELTLANALRKLGL